MIMGFLGLYALGLDLMRHWPRSTLAILWWSGSSTGLGGALSTHTINQIKLLADKYPDAEILLAFDNDTGGQSYAGLIERALKGREGIRRVLPRAPFKDWNEQLQGQPARLSTISVDNQTNKTRNP
ncbi:hypothetical protein CCP3SC15_2100006 [Gammaproteobacteria bacterium]